MPLAHILVEALDSLALAGLETLLSSSSIGVRSTHFVREDEVLLTASEMRTLHRLPACQSNSEIAEALHISPSTVKSHLKSIHRKLRVRTRTQAVLRALQLGLLTWDLVAFELTDDENHPLG
jgi:DNA-binding NarL/FixJ family response regulator